MAYLALYIKEAYYNTIPGAIPIVCPVNSGSSSPVAPVGVRAESLTAAEITTQKITFDKALRRFS